MPGSFPIHRAYLWIGFVLLLAIAGTVAAERAQRTRARATPIAAYLVPVGTESRVKLGWWQTIRLEVPRTLRAGENVAVPPGASVRLVHADSGVAEMVNGPARLLLQQKPPSETQALVSPLVEVIASIPTTVAPPGGTFAVTSPVGMTRYLNPLITWTAREGMSYDVAVTDPADGFVPPRIARGVRPPIALADLQTPQRHQLGVDRNYEVVIREANATTIAGGARFLTTTNAQLENQIPSTPADLIVEAAAAMAKKPTRTGDAWLALSRLPPAWAQSELGVRLRLRVATELGMTDECSRALDDAKRVLKN